MHPIGLIELAPVGLTAQVRPHCRHQPAVHLQVRQPDQHRHWPTSPPEAAPAGCAGGG